MAGRVVPPWWVGYFFDNPLRRWLHPATRVLDRYVTQGQTAVDIGCGHGHFTLGLARLVGPSGRVVAVDLQDKMLAITMKRAARAGLADCIEPHQCRAGQLDLEVEADFVAAFWMVHEVPDPEAFFRQAAELIKPRGCMLVAEPSLKVWPRAFADTVAAARRAGLRQVATPDLLWCRTALLAPEAG